jgi:putative hydroxymethylpyrimidine transport system substrate-binding protein
MKIFISLLIAAAVAVAGCGSDGSAEQATGAASNHEEKQERKLQLLEITIDGRPNADYAGLYLGDHLGYFADVGLKLHVHSPIEPNRPVRYVAEKVVELGVSHQPEVALARERGTPIVAVGSWLPHPTSALIWLKRSHIDGVADLKGKTIATEGLEYQEKYLQAILARENLSLDDVKVIRPKYLMIPALIGGRADAAIGGSWNVEGIQLREEGFDPVVMPVTKLGVPDYEELVLIERRDQLAKNASMVRRFLSALTRGNEAAVADPSAAVKVLKTWYPILNAKAAAEGVVATSPLLSQSRRMDETRWRDLDRWMVEEGLLGKSQMDPKPFTNAYVP